MHIDLYTCNYLYYILYHVCRYAHLCTCKSVKQEKQRKWGKRRASNGVLNILRIYNVNDNELETKQKYLILLSLN